MARKKVTVDKETKKELVGFEEIMDLVDDEIEIRDPRKGGQLEDYEIYDFLEKEILRLEKLDQFFSVQIPIERKYSQTQTLINKEKIDVAGLREDVLDIISKEDSHFFHFMNNLMTKAF